MSCDKEKLSIRLEAHHKAQSSEKFLTFLVKNLKSCIFYLLANPAETTYLSVRDQELFNHKGLVQVRQGKVVFYTVCGWPRRG